MLIMKQEDKEKFLACLQQWQFPRQALLFEYVLNKLYDALSQNQGVKNIPQTTAMHLFLYTSLGSRLADSAPKRTYFIIFRAGMPVSGGILKIMRVLSRRRIL